MASERPAQGRLVALEGIDGSGKTTVAARLVAALEADGHNVVATREPTSSAAGRALREALKDPEHDPVAEALLFAADHAGHVDWVRHHLARGSVVVSDRYSGSCLAYQGATLADGWPEGADGGPVPWLEAVLAPFERTPDLVLLLDLPVETALARLGARELAAEKFERGAFLERVRANYLALAGARDWVVVDAGGPVDATLEACLDAARGLAGGAGPE